MQLYFYDELLIIFSSSLVTAEQLLLRQVFSAQFLLSKIAFSVGFLEGTKPQTLLYSQGILEPSQTELQDVERKKEIVNKGSEMNGECGSKAPLGGLISSSLV